MSSPPDITSRANPKLRYVRRLATAKFRRQEGKLVVEGLRLLEETVNAGVTPAFVLLSAELLDSQRGQALDARLRAADIPTFAVEKAAFRAAAHTDSPQGALAVVPTPQLPLPSSLDLVLVLDGVRDPGNLGTMLRTALAAGADAALIAPHSVDPANPKAVRAAMGAHFHLPVRCCSWQTIRAALADVDVLIADVEGQVDYTLVDWRRPSALVIASEAHGPSRKARALGTTVRIPLAVECESLNAGAACAVILFEAARQRRPPSPSGS